MGRCVGRSLAMIALVIAASTPALAQSPKVTWSDGDSGRFGDIEFRLADVDAPETGPVGSRNGAKCKAEQDKGRAAKAYMQNLTRSGRVTVKQIGEADRYGRQVVEISVDGRNVSASGIAAGHLKPWPHENGKATTARPDWCS